MLSKTALQSATSIVSNLSNKGLMLQAVSGSPVGELVDACYTPAVDNKNCLENMGSWDIVNMICESSGKPVYDDVPVHDKKKDELTTIVANTILGNLSFTRNRVKPIIVSVVDEVVAEQQKTGINIANVMSIVPDTYESIWATPGLVQLVERFRDVPRLGKMGKTNVFPAKTEGELIEMLKTGSSRLDSDVVKLIEEVGSATLTAVWSEFFAIRPDWDEDTSVAYFAGYGPVYRRRALIIHLLANRLAKDVPEGVSLSGSAYDFMIASVIAQTGLAINNVMDFRERQLKGKTLVIQWPLPGSEYRTALTESAQLSVNADVYDTWLKAGGSPEILFGAAITDRNQSFDDLLNEADRYKNAWKQRAAYVRSAQAMEMYRKTVEAIKMAVTRQINALEDEDLVHGTREHHHKALGAYLTTITPRDIDDLYEVAKRVVCHSMFSHRDCLLILDTMDMIGEKEPDLNSREIATLATARILGHFLASQLTVSQVK